MSHNNLHSMDSQNLSCPRCPQICHSSVELISHLRSRHRLTEGEIQTLRGRGYFEEKTQTRDGEIAINHRDAAIRAQASNAINIPFIPPAQRRTVSPPAGWQKTLEGFVYEKLISQVHTIDTIEKKVLRGNVVSNHGALELYIYRKDTGTLTVLQDKERTLEAKLSSYVTGDPEYHEVAEKLYETKQKIREIKQDVGLDTEKDMLIEEWFSGDLNTSNTSEYIEWQEKFMEKALIEAEQVMKQQPKEEIKL